LSFDPIFSDKTVKLIKEHVVLKFPPNPAANKKRKNIFHEYNPLRELGYLKANENEDSSARTDPDSCAKGSL
jgi:hypothetical protein